MSSPFAKATRRIMRRVADESVLIDDDLNEHAARVILDDPESLIAFQAKGGTIDSHATNKAHLATIQSAVVPHKEWQLKHQGTLYRLSEKPLDDGEGLYYCQVAPVTNKSTKSASQYGKFG
ncbi:hypothetical protein [Pseudoalteromonas sp. MMG024]|uniref:head-tail joining protein n=1 Tax=Pseudoalteromonas sp. MMG024 TaxID=2909980 RepID=UPI001F2B1B36|nr:hypothetical protein [Pseudoalteromonas sp. MMG024]MCF6459047.1 hypothetical protein [Pseudoalteromonas sp. MMG024]